MTGYVLLGLGCPADPSQNNRNAVNLKASNDNASNVANAAGDKTPPACTGVTEAELRAKINQLPDALKEQFNNETISLSYDPSNQYLTFTGGISGIGNNMSPLLTGYDEFRGPLCVRRVLFKGNSGKFEWTSNIAPPPPTPPISCRQTIDDTIRNSTLAGQLNQNLFYTYDDGTKVLEFKGYIGDMPGRMQFTTLMTQLYAYMLNGCITKIVFAPKEPSKKLTEQGFGWQLCEYPNCECAGECKPCPCSGEVPNINKNTNSSGNANNSNAP